jgi:hypothetical protein
LRFLEDFGWPGWRDGVLTGTELYLLDDAGVWLVEFQGQLGEVRFMGSVSQGDKLCVGVFGIAVSRRDGLVEIHDSETWDLTAEFPGSTVLSLQSTETLLGVLRTSGFFLYGMEQGEGSVSRWKQAEPNVVLPVVHRGEAVKFPFTLREPENLVLFDLLGRRLGSWPTLRMLNQYLKTREPACGLYFLVLDDENARPRVAAFRLLP